jgi:hypothetical protein
LQHSVAKKIDCSSRDARPALAAGNQPTQAPVADIRFLPNLLKRARNKWILWATVYQSHRQMAGFLLGYSSFAKFASDFQEKTDFGWSLPILRGWSLEK